MPRSKSSNRWLEEHFSDQFVKQSQRDGYRSRAAYKLLELQQKDQLIKPGMTVVDLGAAPGGWSQVLSHILGDRGQVVALDILPMDHFADVHFIQGDFTEQAVYDELMNVVGERQVDLVVSDMAPNLTGNKTTDSAQSMYLVELATEFAQAVLPVGGQLVTKVFQGQGYEAWLKQLRQHFNQVKIRKPQASRDRSAEVYVVATRC